MCPSSSLCSCAWSWDRLNQLEAERHQVQVVDVRVQVVGDEGLTETGTRFLALILYRDAGSVATADADERRAADAFDAMYGDSVT